MERKEMKEGRKRRVGRNDSKNTRNSHREQKRTINAFGFFFCTNIFLGFSTRIKKPSYLTEAMFNQ